jgi:hypothetical protein
MVHPIIYRFRVIDDVYVILSDQKDNINIFSKLLPDAVIKGIESYYISLEENTSEDDIFKGENNYRILDVLKALNTILLVEFGITIYGYYNYYDQDEYAFLNFNNIVIELQKTMYKKITYDDDERKKVYIFPISNMEYNKVSYDGSKYTYINPENRDITKHRMSCNNLIDITYEDFDTRTDVIYKCKETSEYFYLKYLKYKNKYLALRK